MSNTGQTTSITFAEATILAAALALFAAPTLRAQTPIPLPAQLSAAHTVFLASAGAPALAAKENLGTATMYSSMFHALSTDQRLQLVPSPAAAELSMEVSILVTSTGMPGTFGVPSLRLAIYDTKTHSLIWTIDEPLEGAFREKTFEHNLDEAANKIAADLESLAGGVIPGQPGSAPKPDATKARTSQDQ
jgi:hypothetical protein